jgi:hypothetical protein
LESENRKHSGGTDADGQLPLGELARLETLLAAEDMEGIGQIGRE